MKNIASTNGKLVGIVCIFILQSCARPVAVQGFDQNSSNVLLQDSRGRPLYIFLLKDTAYYEFRQFDKPSYFTDFDTLIRINNCDCYQGKTSHLYITDKIISLTHSGYARSGNNFLFAIASEKQIKKWNSYKNIDKLNPYGNILSRPPFQPYRTGSLYDSLHHDWQNLLPLTLTLNQRAFDSVLNNFKSKYSIK